jgi:hypothetical protein
MMAGGVVTRGRGGAHRATIPPPDFGVLADAFALPGLTVVASAQSALFWA